MTDQVSLIAELSCVPVGTSSTSTSQLVAEAVKALRGVKGIRYQVTPTSTALEAESFEALFQAIRAAHDAMARAGAKRIVSHIKIDDRRDSKRTLEDALASLQRHLAAP
jgi:uncharacterized protein (TIGR00106 family)